jgi:hypothetical protein
MICLSTGAMYLLPNGPERRELSCVQRLRRVALLRER